MSKSKGNVIDPWTVLDSRGAEALRWYMVSSGSPWTPKRVFVDAIDESSNRFLRTLWNTYAFFVTYANLDGWTPGSSGATSEHVLDRWIRSRTHRTLDTVTTALDSFDALAGAQALLQTNATQASNGHIHSTGCITRLQSANHRKFGRNLKPVENWRWKTTEPESQATIRRHIITRDRMRQMLL